LSKTNRRAECTFRSKQSGVTILRLLYARDRGGAMSSRTLM